ncbi:MAG TPA: tRNA pseudouridine(55) synthase TruB, partial [Candidatus Cloacimonadota bacterium]|nr:tRNA pseudouridine(55) synthase TruB [Candidatus Cloacimonadota bacterium]
MQDTGFLLIDKPEGITSFNVIAELRKITRIRKIGHTGTLDPFASGLLLIAVGNATRFIEFFGDDVKTYEVIAEF